MCLDVDVASSMTRQEIEKDWDWLFSNVCETLHSFDKEEDITEFVIKKIESVIATTQENQDFEGRNDFFHKFDKLLLSKNIIFNYV